MTQMLRDFDGAGEHVVWTHQWLCTEAGCPPVVGNILVYRDDNHMTGTYASFIAPLLDEAIAPVVEWYAQPPVG